MVWAKVTPFRKLRVKGLKLETELSTYMYLKLTAESSINHCLNPYMSLPEPCGKIGHILEKHVILYNNYMCT